MPKIEAEFATPDYILNFYGSQYDLIVAMHCLGEMSRDEALSYLREFGRIVKPGGHLYLMSWKHENLRGERREQCSKLSDYEPVLCDDWRFVFRRPWPDMFDANPAEEWLLERK